MSSAPAWDKDGFPVTHPEPWGRHGAFTTIRVEGDPPRPLFLDAHLNRLEESSSLLGMELIATKEQILERLTVFLSSLLLPAPFLLRICLFEDCLGFSSRPANTGESSLTGKILRHLRPVPKAKSTADKELYGRLNELDLTREDLLLVHPEEEVVLESATSNLVFAQGNHLIIPEQDILPGIVLGKLLEVIGRDFSLERTSPRLDELPTFDEIILCGSGREISSFAAIPEADWQSRSEKTFLHLRETYGTLKADHA
ncbi:uncharacterized protein METZ01_LOCUS317489 [marine metagenome]|uniref:Aminotransferase class IV n=1 Tax=marine metagenome TaxID=408172 RepID=A0A382NWA2_9ZZZZ